MAELTEEWIDRTARAQLRLDAACPEEMERDYRIMLNPSPLSPPEGARLYPGTVPSFRFIVYESDAYLMVPEPLLEDLREAFGSRAPEWMLKVPNLRRLEDILVGAGYCIFEIQECFLPRAEAFFGENEDPSGMIVFDETEFLIRNLSPEEIREFAALGEDSFGKHAFPGSGTEQLAFGMVAGERCAGVCGAQRDGRFLWQLGVDVKEEFCGFGIATELIYHTAAEVLHRGFLPFYGSNPGHIVSKRAALSAGFRPAWTEVFAGFAPEGTL